MKRIVLIVGCSIWMMFMLIGCAAEEERKEGTPDVINSISSNRDQYLTVVANRNEITDKEAFAWELIEMCRDNSFHTIKFSTDRGYATRILMKVYLWKDEIEGYDPVMEIDYKSIEWNKDYDIVNNPEKFLLYVDGNLVKTP